MKIDEAIEKLERMKRNYLLSQNISFRIDWNEVQGVLDLLKEAKEEQERLLDIIENYGSQLGRLGVTCQSKKDK